MTQSKATNLKFIQISLIFQHFNVLKLHKTNKISSYKHQRKTKITDCTNSTPRIVKTIKRLSMSNLNDLSLRAYKKLDFP